eukprot:13688205-Alexandrium_andersonii.AAC.1
MGSLPESGPSPAGRPRDEPLPFPAFFLPRSGQLPPHFWQVGKSPTRSRKIHEPSHLLHTT